MGPLKQEGASIHTSVRLSGAPANLEVAAAAAANVDGRGAFWSHQSKAGETVEEAASPECSSCAHRAGNFNGFHLDGLERRENTVVLSTSLFLKLRLVSVLTRGLGGKEKVRSKSRSTGNGNETL